MINEGQGEQDRYSGMHLPADIMILSPPASSFSNDLTCASARSRTSTKHELCLQRNSSGEEPSTRTVSYHLRAEALSVSGVGVS